MSSTAIWIIRAGFVALIAAIPFAVDAFWLNMAILALIYSLVVYSVVILTGFTGLLSFGQAGFVGLGAYTYGVLTVKGVSPAAAAACGVLLPTLVGFLLALPAARLRGHYMAIGTLGFGILVGQLLNNMVGVTRGPMGLLGIKSFGFDRVTWFYVVLCISLLVMAALEYLDRRTFLGVVLKSVKYDEISAAASGIGVFGIKLIALLGLGLAGRVLRRAARGLYALPDAGPVRQRRVVPLSDDGGGRRCRQRQRRADRVPHPDRRAGSLARLRRDQCAAVDLRRHGAVRAVVSAGRNRRSDRPPGCQARRAGAPSKQARCRWMAKLHPGAHRDRIRCCSSQAFQNASVACRRCRASISSGVPAKSMA